MPDLAADLAALGRAGILGAKAFTCHSGIDDFPASDRETLRAAMVALRAAGVPLLVHAELESPVEVSGAPTAYPTFLASRPARWEDDAVRMVIELVRETGCAAHIVHLSSASAVPLLAAARAEGLPITVETCPHYLGVTAEEVPDGDTAFTCGPPIREAGNRERLWEALAAGAIDVVVTDHSPCTPHLKLPERGDFLEAWGGIASLQLGLRAVWGEAARRGHVLADLCRWMCEGPAKVAGLPQKGTLRPGGDADLVAFDPDAAAPVDAQRLQHRHKVTPYAGRVLRGEVVHVWSRGRRLVQGGRFSDDAPGGRALLGRRG